MKIKVQKEALLKALQKVSNIIGSRTTLPVLANILVEAKDDQLTLTTTDLELRLTTTVAAVVEEPGITTLPAKKLLGLVSKFHQGEVSITSNENFHSEIKCGTVSITLLGLTPDDFPVAPEFEINRNVKIKQTELASILERISYAASLDDSRKVLTGMAEICGFPEKVVDITVAIDKIDKIGLDAVEAEMAEKGLSHNAIEVIRPILNLTGTTVEKIAVMRDLMSGKSASGLVSETGLKGLDELEELFGYIEAAGIRHEVEIDLSLARGLNYYTGAIFEVKAKDFAIGSICGGGRYDNLTGIFGLPNMSGVGISFGADRIYDVLKGLDKFPSEVTSTTKVLFANMGVEELKYLIPVVKSLRESGVACEIYPEQTKLKKQFDYADKKAIPFLSIVGGNEIAEGVVNIKNLSTGEQKSFGKDDVATILEFLQ